MPRDYSVLKEVMIDLIQSYPPRIYPIDFIKDEIYKRTGNTLSSSEVQHIHRLIRKHYKVFKRDTKEYDMEYYYVRNDGNLWKQTNQ